tara:strand:+ start:1901 stop:2245 length:345 start_codon:yes stop_codon:yes gene_type:complete
MKKKTHTYNTGDIVTFKFLTGDIMTGKITEHTWKEDDTPSYKIKVEDSRGFTIYPCMADDRIIKREMTARAADKEFNLKANDILRKQHEKKPGKSELDDAIKAQKDFINGVKND